MKKAEFVPWYEALLPQKTDTYMPVPHMELLQIVESRLLESGYTITKRSVEQSTDGQVIIAHFLISKGEGELDYTQEFGVVNSYNKTKPIVFASGGHVFICANGMVVSEFTTVRKHTSKVWDEIYDKLTEAIEKMEYNWEKLQQDVLKMTLTFLNLTQKAEVLGRLFVEEEVITITELSKIKKELSKPTHDYEACDTLWELYNYVTFVLKDAHILRKTEALKKTHDFMVEYANDYVIINK